MVIHVARLECDIRGVIIPMSWSPDPKRTSLEGHVDLLHPAGGSGMALIRAVSPVAGPECAHLVGWRAQNSVAYLRGLVLDDV